MNRNVFKLLLLLPLLLLLSCGGHDSFRITANAPGLGTQNINVIYYADGSFHTTRINAVDGKFAFEASCQNWTPVYFFTNNRTLLGLVVVKNGDNIEATFKPGEFAEVKMSGNEPSELMAQWMTQNANVLNGDDPAAINRAVKNFVEKNRDNIASTVVLTNFFDCSLNVAQADSLLMLIDSKARPSYITEGWTDRLEAFIVREKSGLPDTLQLIDTRDTLRNIPTRKGTLLLYFSPELERNRTTDEFLRKHMVKDTLDSLGIRFYEINRNVSDTLAWKRRVRTDNLPWTRVWHPFNVRVLPALPTESIMVIDSTGNIIYNDTGVVAGVERTNLKTL